MILVENRSIWESSADLVVVTTNSSINKYGELIMGRGAAKEAKDRFPLLPKVAGEVVRNLKRMSMNDYGFVFFNCFRLPAIFQVKHSFYDKAKLGLIKISTKMLNDFALKNREKSISMNFPGIGYGGLGKEEILPIISVLPDNVSVHFFTPYP